jgi:hypothetical protein
MNLARSVADVLRDHVVLELESIDRMYLNVYVPHLQTVGAVVGYLHCPHKGQRFESTATVAPMTDAFVRNIEHFVEREGVDMVVFDRKQRKDDVTQQYCSASRRPKACSMSAKPRRRRGSCARNVGVAQAARMGWQRENAAMLQSSPWRCENVTDSDF